ncbi:MAG: ATP-binding cassette domain-containing protein [Acidobacteria bacterium]|nr:ATP-binding cassette domain-containing protein [Acidobacteriota bacterium]
MKVEDLVVSYYKKEILRGASLDVSPGQIVALIGANGSGKSTLLRTVAGLIRPTAGRISVDDMDITGIEAHALAGSGIGLLLQGGVIFPRLTVLEHLRLAAEKIPGTSFEERAEAVWTAFPFLSNIRGKRAGLLSGGERQMLALSMLIVRRSRLWLLDEPSGGLAPSSVKSLLNTIRKFNAEHGVTVLLAEQNVREALRIADKVYALKDGMAFLQENPKEIVNARRMEEIFL